MILLPLIPTTTTTRLLTLLTIKRHQPLRHDTRQLNIRKYVYVLVLNVLFQLLLLHLLLILIAA